MKAKIWIHKSREAIFIKHQTSTMNQSSNIVINKPKLSFWATRSSILFCKIWINRSHMCAWTRLSMNISSKQLGKELQCLYNVVIQFSIVNRAYTALVWHLHSIYYMSHSYNGIFDTLTTLVLGHWILPLINVEPKEWGVENSPTSHGL